MSRISRYQTSLIIFVTRAILLIVCGGLSNFAHDLSNNTHALFESKQKESARKAHLKMADHLSSSSSESEFEEKALLLTLLLRRHRYRRFES